MSTLPILKFIIGGLYLLLGFLVLRYPLAISGYGLLSEEKRKLVDMEGVKRVLSVEFIIFGVILLVGGLLEAMGVMAGKWIFIVALLLSPVVLGFSTQRYDRNPQGKSKSFLIIYCVVVVVACVAMLLFPRTEANEITIEENMVYINGDYGINFPIANIDSLQWETTAPKISERTNGYRSGKREKGYFILSNGQKAWLLLENRSEPYIRIVFKGLLPPKDMVLLVNTNDEAESRALFDDLTTLYENQKREEVKHEEE